MAKLTAKRRTTHPLWPPPKSLEPGLWPILAEALGLQFLPKSANQKKKEYMAILKAARRNKLAKSTFGLPGSRKYPMPDKSHAANAKARATQMLSAGKLSPASAAKIRAKANRILGK